MGRDDSWYGESLTLSVRLDICSYLSILFPATMGCILSFCGRAGDRVVIVALADMYLIGCCE